MRFPSYLRRILLFSMLLGTLPIILVGFFSYMKSSSMIQEKVNEENIQILVEKQLRVDSTLKVMDNNLIQFICSPVIVDSMNMTFLPDDFQMLNKLLKSLALIQNSELNVQSSHLINNDKDWSISNNGIYQQGLNSNDFILKNYMHYPGTSFWIDDNSSDKITFVRKIPMNSITPSGLVSMEFPSIELEKFLYTEDETDEVMLLDKDFNIIVHKGTSIIGSKLLPDTIINKIKNLDTTKGYLNLKINGIKVGITFSKSSYNGWVYINIVSMKEVTKDSNAIGWFTFFVCIIVLIISCVVSFQGSHKIYNPVEKLCEALIKDFGQEGNKGGKDEFQFIRERFHYLIDTQSKMANTIKGQMSQLEELFYIKLLKGKLKPEDLSEHFKLSRYPSSLKLFYILAVKIDTLKGTRYMEQDRDLMMYAINNIVGELVPEQNYINSLLMDDLQITLIGCNNDEYSEMKNHTFNVAQRIQETVNTFLQLKISFGISSPFNEFKDIHLAYNNATEALKHTTLLGQEIILFREDMKLSQTSSRFGFPQYIEYELIDAIKSSENEKAKKLLHQFRVEVFKEGLTFSQYHIYLTRLLIDLIEMLQELGEPFDTLLGDGNQLFDQMFKIKTMQDIEDWFQYSIIEPVMQILKDFRKSQYKKISSEIINIIHKHYDTELSLESCASLMNYHPSYISRVFSAEMGTSFSKYLSRYRLDVAKKWLSGTDIKIQEIAERLQYNNSQNFIRNFKKSEGLTPGQYRTQCYKFENHKK